MWPRPNSPRAQGRRHQGLGRLWRRSPSRRRERLDPRWVETQARRDSSSGASCRTPPDGGLIYSMGFQPQARMTRHASDLSHIIREIQVWPGEPVSVANDMVAGEGGALPLGARHPQMAPTRRAVPQEPPAKGYRVQLSAISALRVQGPFPDAHDRATWGDRPLAHAPALIRPRACASPHLRSAFRHLPGCPSWRAQGVEWGSTRRTSILRHKTLDAHHTLCAAASASSKEVPTVYRGVSNAPAGAWRIGR